MLRGPVHGRLRTALILVIMGVATGSVAGCSLVLDFGGGDESRDASRADARARPDAEPDDVQPDATPRADAPPGQCENEVRDGDESGIDCGGGCAPCAIGRACTVAGDCVSGACALGLCEEHPRSCASALLATGGTTSGVITIDGDGAGPLAARDAYCEQTIAAGGWELVSAVPQGGVVVGGVLQPLVSAGTCLDPAATCAGHLAPAQVTAQTEILIVDATAGDYLLLSGFSGGPTSSLRYLSRERGLTISDACTAPHVCATTTIDPGLTLATSGYAMAYTPPLVQWWRYGGWYVGAGPSASLLAGNVFRASYNGNNNLSTRTTPGGTSTFRASGTQRLYARIPAVPARAP